MNGKTDLVILHPNKCMKFTLECRTTFFSFIAVARYRTCCTNKQDTISRNQVRVFGVPWFGLLLQRFLMLLFMDISPFIICPIVSAVHVRVCHWMTVPSGLAAILFQCSRPEPTAKSSGPRQRRPRTRFVSERRRKLEKLRIKRETMRDDVQN